jgi:hypothetical protein
MSSFEKLLLTVGFVSFKILMWVIVVFLGIVVAMFNSK